MLCYIRALIGKKFLIHLSSSAIISRRFRKYHSEFFVINARYRIYSQKDRHIATYLQISVVDSVIKFHNQGSRKSIDLMNHFLDNLYINKIKLKHRDSNV